MHKPINKKIMKKILLAFLLCFTVLGVYADDWNDGIKEMVASMNEEAADMEEQMASMGLDVKIKSYYNASKKEIVMDMRFKDASMWGLFDKNVMEVSKQSTIEEYRTSYKTDDDFREFVHMMKEQKAKFKIIYSCEVGGEVKTKDFTITAEEIMK